MATLEEVEAQLRKLSRANRALSTCNGIVVRARDEGELLREICRAVVDCAGFRMCWVGRVEHDERQTVRPVAWAGHEAAYLETADITWADTERGRGPVGTAVRTGRPVVLRDAATTADFAPWRAEALTRGYASMLAVPLRLDGEVTGALNIYAAERDAFDEAEVALLTELAEDLAHGVISLRTRAALEEAQAAAEAASRAKDDFLRVAAHELRTPLTPILGWAQILRDGKVTDPAQIQRGLDVILRSARAEARLVDDLLDVSQIAAGAMPMDMHPVDLAPLVRACLDELGPAAAAKGVAVEARTVPEAPLLGDARRLQQAARGLLSNALKFTPRGGRVSVDLARERGALVLAVRDTGKGIPACELPHVFDRFHSGDPSTTRSEGGLGLGLSIVRHIVEAHGGTVRAESAGRGRGATLVAELPATRSSERATLR